MHPLRAHLKKTGETQKSFADRLGISRSYLSRILCGRDMPGLHLQAHIELLTGGAVKRGWK